jgi:hypothetical protein
MVKTFLFYFSMLPLTVGIISAIMIITMLIATGIAGIILGAAYAMTPTPTGI